MAHDIVIVGGGLSGQLAGYLLFKRGFSVVLCEAKSNMEAGAIDFGRHFNVMTAETANRLEISIPWIEAKSRPVMLEKMNWIPAMDHQLSPEQKVFYLDSYTVPKGGVEKLSQFLSLYLKVEWGQIIQSLDVEESRIQSISSAQKTWEAKAYLMALPFESLASFVSPSFFHPQFLKGLKKQQFVSAIQLSFILNKKICNEQNILFLSESNGVGFFPTNVDPSLSDGGGPMSQWIFFLKQEDLLDPEGLTKKLRSQKRWIRKAFPDFFDHVEWEKIVVIDRLFPKVQSPKPLRKEWTLLKNMFWVGDYNGGPSPNENGLIPTVLQEVQKIEEYLALR